MCPRLKHNSKSTKFGFSEGYPQTDRCFGPEYTYAIYAIFLGPRDFPEKHLSRKPARKNNTWLSSVLLSSPSDSLIQRKVALVWCSQGAQNHNSLLKAKLQGCIFLDS